jgi:hypothetical protein
MAATIPIDCTRCGKRIDASVGESVSGTSYSWWQAYACPNCGAMLEGSGQLPLPDHIRQVLLKERGEWALHVAPVGIQTVATMRVLRSALGLSVAEVSKLRALWPGEIATGTWGEMERLRRLLVAEGLDCSDVRAASAHGQPRAPPEAPSGPGE